jgi:hypothetical protein
MKEAVAKIYDKISNIEVINYSDLPHNEIYDGADPFSKKGIERFKAYIKDIDAIYYGKPKEVFNLFDAISLAYDNDKNIVVVDNLS